MSWDTVPRLASAVKRDLGSWAYSSFLMDDGGGMRRFYHNQLGLMKPLDFFNGVPFTRFRLKFHEYWHFPIPLR